MDTQTIISLIISLGTFLVTLFTIVSMASSRFSKQEEKINSQGRRIDTLEKGIEKNISEIKQMIRDQNALIIDLIKTK